MIVMRQHLQTYEIDLGLLVGRDGKSSDRLIGPTTSPTLGQARSNFK